MRGGILVLLAGLAVLFCGARQASAAGITYSESSTASGSIGGTTFSNELVAVTFVGNTSNIFALAPGLWFNNVGTATVTIGGLGTFSLTDAIEAFDNQSGAAGIADASQLDGPVIFDTLNSAFATSALATAIGPLTGSGFGGVGGNFATTDGSLTFTAIDADSTFTATTATPAPEPSSLVGLGIGLSAVALARRRRLA